MRTLAMTRSITGAKVSAVSSTGMPSMCATITDGQSVNEAVRVARGIPSLEAGLVHPSPTEVVAVREEPRVDAHATGLDVRVNASHPSADAVRVEDVVPRRVERVGEIHAPAVAAYLHHLGRPRQPQLWGGGVRASLHDAAQAHRTRLFRVVRIADVILLELAGPPARDVQPAVVDRQVDVAH